MSRKRKLEECLLDDVPSSSKQTNFGKYHVFLSFRGPDTRNNFAAHLYDRLTAHGFHVFKDDKEIIEGEEINEDLKKAISNSSICIPIFSRTYASSKACLRELCHMIETKSKIIPIFYDVTPDDVKLKTPLYTSALEDHRHNSKVELDEVNKWENALSRATEIAGFDIANKNEAEEITSITRKLSIQLMPKYQDVTNHLVEMDNAMRYVENLLNLNFGGFQIIGIFGMGGVGKTTLAKLIFNRHCSAFPSGCSFLANVRENWESNRLLELQRQLYKDIISPSFANSIDDPNNGKIKIKEALKNKKVLLVLDDMNSTNQFTDLVGHGIRFASGSRMIITTRNERTLDVLKQDAHVVKYKLEEMDYDRAVKLFSRNAFRRDFPPKEFQPLSKQVVSHIKGLPLALEVFGSSLCGRSIEEWEEKLEELKNIPDKSIHDRLMISYQELKSNQQKIFLDIASYHGELRKLNACSMWKDCRWYPESAIQDLKDRSLIKVIKDKYGGEMLWMHDILKDFGRAIIQEESNKSGGILSRLQINTSLEVLHENKEKASVEMLSISETTITREDMAGLCKLRFLELRYCDVMGNFEDLFPNLRWLSLINVRQFEPINFQPKNLVALSLSQCEPINFQPKNLVALSLSQCDIDLSAMKADKLKVLYLKNSFYDEAKIPFKKFSSLEVVILVGPNGLTEIATSSTELKNLTQLTIRDSDWADSREIRLSKWVDPMDCIWIGNLTSLYKLELSNRSIIELPNSIRHLKELKELRVTGSYLKRVPELPSGLTHLYICSWSSTMQVDWSTQFKLMNIIELELKCACRGSKEGNYLSFEWIKSATNLKKLHLHIPYILTGLEKVAELSLLKHLELFHAEFQQLQRFPSSLLELGIHRCNSLNENLDVSNLKDLKSFQLSWCKEIRNIRGFAELEFLECVRICSCGNLQELSPADLSKLKNAQNLTVGIISESELPDIHPETKAIVPQDHLTRCPCPCPGAYFYGFPHCEGLS